MQPRLGAYARRWLQEAVTMHHLCPLLASTIGLGCRARQDNTTLATRSDVHPKHPGPRSPPPTRPAVDPLRIRRACTRCASVRKYGHPAANGLRSVPAYMTHRHWPHSSWRTSSARSGLPCRTQLALSLRPKFCCALNHVSTPYTVSVYPIEQEPGVWFATYLISEYSDGMERIVANVSMRHNVHGTESLARHAGRLAGTAAITRLATRHQT